MITVPPPLKTTLTKSQIHLLLSGLTSLEGAFGALQQSVPQEVHELKKVLLEQGQKLTFFDQEILTTREVSKLLGTSTRRVNQLGAGGVIKIIQYGGRGRGCSNLYDAESVRKYIGHAVNDQQ